MALSFPFSAPLRQFGVYISKCWCTQQRGRRRAVPDIRANTSRQSPKATCTEHHPFPAAQSCLKGPHIHLSPRCAVGAGSLLQTHHTASPWSRHSPTADMDAFPFKTLLLLLLPQPHGVGFQPRRRRGCLPALPRKRSSAGESGMYQGGVQHPPHITVPSLPLLPQKDPVMSHQEVMGKKKNLFWEDFGSYKVSSSVK